MAFYSTPLIALTEKGLYCEEGNFYIDPHRSVENAVVTHAHSDHARRGSKNYFCALPGVGLLKSRLGKTIHVEGVPYRKEIRFGEIIVSFHSAGHILGSAQVRVQRGSEVWVASGDYKREPDPSCDPFEIVKCETLITEATFGTPKYIWNKNLDHGKMMYEWWEKNAQEHFHSIIFGYSLGKAQRILAELAPWVKKPILIHPSIADLTECYREEGRKLAETKILLKGECDKKELILAPPSILKEDWFKEIGPYKTAFASGWMATSSGYFRGGYDHGFVMSDHADWEDLNRTVKDSGATRVFVQHRNGSLVRHLRKQGIDAHPVEALIRKNYDQLGGINLRLL